MLALTFAALLAASDPQMPAPAQAVPQIAQTDPQSEPTDLEDVEVIGRPLQNMVRDFVNEVAAPNRYRGLARWNGGLCVGVANLRAETAQYIADRVSTVAEDHGLTPGRPGCRPNVMVIASDDPDGLAEMLSRESRLSFRPGGSGMDRGGDAFERFKNSDSPVRWWSVSVPVDSWTGKRAVRLPGECNGACLSPADYAPVISVFSASRMSTQIVDQMIRSIIIVDIDQASRVSQQQLADYVAFVALAQIDPQADTSGYASILNVFDDPESAQSLTNWDRAYLGGLYDAVRTRANRRAARIEIADSIERAHGMLQSEQAED